MASPNLPVDVADLKTLVPSVTDAQAAIYISTADAIIKAHGIPQAYTPEVAYLIELYVAAHYASLGSVASGTSGGSVESVKVGNSEETYANPNEGLVGIASSSWGNMALGLDTLGLLSGMSANPLKAQFQVYGRDSCELYPIGGH